MASTLWERGRCGESRLARLIMVNDQNADPRAPYFYSQKRSYYCSLAFGSFAHARRRTQTRNATTARVSHAALSPKKENDVHRPTFSSSYPFEHRRPPPSTFLRFPFSSFSGLIFNPFLNEEKAGSMLEPNFQVMSFSQQDGVKARKYQKRKTHAKSKTGCATCKVKRIKVHSSSQWRSEVLADSGQVR